MEPSESAMGKSLFTSAEKMQMANNYNDWTFSLFQKFIRGSLLEVGCGTGSFTHRIIENGGFSRFLSIDISQNAIDYCRSKFSQPTVEFQWINVKDVQGKFDAVICMNVLEHIEDDQSAFQHMLGLLNPGGVLFLLVPAHQALYSRFDAEGGHYRRYNKQAVQKLLENVPDHSRYQSVQYYFNTIGALGYGFVYKILQKVPQSNAESEIGFFDKIIVPILRKLEGRHMPFGISVITEIIKDEL